MKELNDIVTSKISTMIKDKTIENMIESQLQSTLKDIIEKSMRAYSDFGKIISEKIEKSFAISANKITIPEYNKFIQEIVNDKFLEILKKEHVDVLQGLIENVTGTVDKQLNFSDIMDMVREHWGADGECHDFDEISIEARKSDSEESIYITLKHPEFSFYNVRLVLYNFKNSEDDFWHIGYIQEDEKAITIRPTNIAKSTHGVTNQLFKWYAMETKFVEDEEFDNIYLYDD